MRYLISYDNALNAYDVHNVILVDSLPPEVEYISCSAGGTYDDFGHTVTWEIGTLVPGHEGQATVRVSVDDLAPVGTLIRNRVEIEAEETPTTQATDAITVCTDLIPIDLVKNEWIDSTCAVAGDTITYEISYENLNFAGLNGVVVTDYLPQETDFASSSPGGTYEPSTHTVTWEIGSLAGHESGSVGILATVNSGAVPGATIINRCEAVSDETPVVACQAVTPICPPYDYAPLNLAKTDGRDGVCVNPGGGMTYVISYDNNGNPEEVHDVVLVDNLSSRVTFLSATDGGVYSAIGHKVTWDLGTLPGASGGSVEAAVRVKDSTPPGVWINNTCQIVSTETGLTQTTLATKVCEPAGPVLFKVAVHVEAHDDRRTCSSNMPVLETCADIKYTSEAQVYSVDAFPVFFDLVEYQGVEYALSWCDSGTCYDAVFTSCSDFSIGDIEHSGDGIAQAWTSCHPGPCAVPGWAWIYADGPTTICVVGHPETWSVHLLDCASRMGNPEGSYCAGICGDLGDDPCATTDQRPTTWGDIKAIFK
jgi:uncharacterized repeat protein (TIGR01451 family)